MTLRLYAHPFSSYCQKVLIALHENATPFELRMLDADHPDHDAEFRGLWPIGKFPLLVDGHRPVHESSIIIEYLGLHHPGPVNLIPADPAAALEVRLLDRVFDQYVMSPMQKIVSDAMQAPERKDDTAVNAARAQLQTIYGWLDNWLGDRLWAAGADFTLADCAAAPSLLYADWVHPIGETCANLRALRARLLARPSVARVVDDARPYRPFFPPGAPDRD